MTRRYSSDADIVVEEIEPAPAVDGGFHQPFAFGLDGDVAGMGRRYAPLGLDHVDRALRKPEVAIGDQHVSAGARQKDRGGPAIADAVAHRTAAAHQCDLAGQAGVVLGPCHRVSSLCQFTIADAWLGSNIGVIRVTP
jgi:hypothetical protein